jgi:glycosyltransferase involved in cell wall biosynthesis
MTNYTPWATKNQSAHNITKSNKPKMTVFSMTNRVGAMDILFESLRAQSFQDFEVVIVDGIYRYRKNIVAEKAKQYNFIVKHLPSIVDSFPVPDYCNAINTGLINAEGEIFFFTCDYAYMQKDTLLTHANFHANTPKTHILMLPCSDALVKLDAVSDNFPKHRQYGHRGNPDATKLLTVPEEQYCRLHAEWSDRYKEDLDNGFLDKVLWSIFKEPFIYEQGIDHLVQNIVLDNKFADCSTTEPTPAFHDLCCIKNNSFKTELLIDANGYDEQMDRTWGFFDTEGARRLLRCHDAKFFAMNTLHDTVINTRYYLEPRKCVDGYKNIKIIDAKFNKEQPITYGAVADWKKNKVLQ